MHGMVTISSLHLHGHGMLYKDKRDRPVRALLTYPSFHDFQACNSCDSILCPINQNVAVGSCLVQAWLGPDLYIFFVSEYGMHALRRACTTQTPAHLVIMEFDIVRLGGVVHLWSTRASNFALDVLHANPLQHNSSPDSM